MTPPFPLRVAAGDVGSNAVRFVAAEFRDPRRRVEIHSRRVPVRLGHHAFLTGRLTGENIERTVETMASFRQTLDGLGGPEYRIVATSAVRESRNGPELVERVRAEAGLRMEVIDGAEEARLVVVAVRERLPLTGGWLLVDLGGGSIEVSVVRDGRIRSTGSRPMGTVRLLEEWTGPGAGEGEGGPKEDRGLHRRELDRRLQRLVEAHGEGLEVPSLAEGGLRGLIATGGNIEALAELAGARPDAAGVSRLSLAALRETKARLAELTAADRVERLGLRPDRADVIVPAAHVYQWVAERAGSSTFVVPNVGVKEGVLLDLMEARLGAVGEEAERERREKESE